MQVSVVICTQNRAARLQRSLRGFVDMRVPSNVSWELIVVANACTDETPRVLADFEHQLPLHIVHEPVPGLSHARNSGVHAASGEYILWTDDDVLVNVDWMCEYAEAFRAHPEAAFFGGRIDLLFEPPAPEWLLSLLAWPAVSATFARRDFGDEPFQLCARSLPYGANFAVRADIQREYAYDEALGQRPEHIGVGEETRALFAMLADGAIGWWVPSAKVTHVISRERQCWAHIQAHWRAQGIAMAVQARHMAGPRLLGRPFALWRAALAAELEYRAHQIAYGRARSVPYMGRACIAWSLLKAASRM